MTENQCFIFYSWASDHPASTTRTFIEKALQRAVNDLHRDEAITVVPVIDRDTQGVPGSPDIASTIFGKIDKAQIFVCDVSIVDKNAMRPSPNPNVLIELGYALKTLGHERIIMIMNTAFGVQDLLPFDLRIRRVTPYSKIPDSDDQGEARKQLQSTLVDALRIILQGIDQQDVPNQVSLPSEIAQEAMVANSPDAGERIRQYMEWLGKQVATLTPKRTNNDQAQWEEDLLGAISASVPIVLEFTQLVQTAVAYKAMEALGEIYEGFSHVLDLYHTPRGFSGSYMESDFDLPRFLGHEMFVTFCALLLRSKRWDTLADLLNRDIYVTNGDYHEPGLQSYNALSDYVQMLGDRKVRLKLNRLSLHADSLNERHSNDGPLAQALPMVLLTEADYFLYARGYVAPNTASRYSLWRPWSTVFMNGIPRFLIESVKRSVAEPLAQALGVSSANELRDRFGERVQSLGFFFDDPFRRDSLDGFDPQTIGSR